MRVGQTHWFLRHLYLFYFSAPPACSVNRQGKRPERRIHETYQIRHHIRHYRRFFCPSFLGVGCGHFSELCGGRVLVGGRGEVLTERPPPKNGSCSFYRPLGIGEPRLSYIL